MTAPAVPLARAEPVWAAIRARLDGWSLLTTVLQGSDRLFLEGEYGSDLPASAEPYRRLVLVPGMPLYAEVYAPAQLTTWRWLLRADVEDRPALAGFRPHRVAEAILAQAHQAVSGWTPDPVPGLVRVATPIAMTRAPQAAPGWDEMRRVWWLSSEYRVDVVPG